MGESKTIIFDQLFVYKLPNAYFFPYWQWLWSTKCEHVCIFLSQEHIFLALCWKCSNLDTFYVWLIWNGINSLLNTNQKKVTILRIFWTSTFGLFGCIPPKKGNWYLSFIPTITIRGINNLLAHGFLISMAQSEVYDQCLQ